MIKNANFRKDKIPMWINVLSVVVVLILIFKTYASFFNPALVYGTIDNSIIANQKVLWELAGRNICMIVVGIMALRAQNAMLFAFTMVINLVRESFDMFMGIKFAAGDIKQMGQAMSFLVFLIPYFFALKKLYHLARNN